MESTVNSRSPWSAASFADVVEPSSIESSALGLHLNLCKRLNGRLFALHCAAESVHGFVTSRIVTSIALVAMVSCIASTVL